MDFCHENHWQMRNGVHVVTQPGSSFFVFDEFNHFQRKLVQERLGGRNVDDGKLDAAHVCADHGYVFHGVHSTDSFDDQQNLLSVCLLTTFQLISLCASSILLVATFMSMRLFWGAYWNGFMEVLL